MYNLKTLGGRLRQARELTGLPQLEVVSRTGIPQTTIQRYEKDQVKEPRQDFMEKFAALYGTTVEELLNDPYTLSHYPWQMQEMLYDKDSMPFIAEAFVKYQEWKAKEAMKKLLEKQ